MAAERLAYLDGIRGLAAAAVLGFHAEALVDWHGWFSRGYLAVDVFFFLSGFVLAHARGSGIRPTQFYWMRFARTYPVHLAAIVLLLPLYGSPGFSGHELVMSLLLLQGPWLDQTVWNWPAWSISAEWHAYIVFPFVAPFLLQCRNRTAWLAAFCCVAVCASLVVITGYWARDTGTGVLVHVLPEFTIGILLYRLWLAGRLPSLPIIARVLSSAPLRFLGHISYSLYMVQAIPMAYIVFKASNLLAVPVFSACLFLVTTFLLALPMSFLIEHPARRLLRQLSAILPNYREPIGAVAARAGTTAAEATRAAAS